MVTVRKLSYAMPVRVVDGVPQCPCCQEPMVERDGGWMCALGAAFLDVLTAATADADRLLLAGGGTDG